MTDTMTRQDEFIVFRREDYFQLMGELALPPWWDDKHKEYIGGSMDCAPLGQRIEARTEEVRLRSVRVDDSESAGVRGAITPEELAQFFHEQYERMAPEFGYKTRDASAVPWADVPEENKGLMQAVCTAVLLQFFPDRAAINFRGPADPGQT